MARHVTGPGSRWQDLLLIYFQRQVVRIAKEGKAFTGKGIDTNRFALHAMRGEMGYRGVDVIHAKGQMTQPAGFRTTGAGWRKRCLLYTSDAADDLLCVDLGGRRNIKNKKQQKQKNRSEQ